MISPGIFEFGNKWVFIEFLNLAFVRWASEISEEVRSKDDAFVHVRAEARTSPSVRLYSYFEVPLYNRVARLSVQ